MPDDADLQTALRRIAGHRNSPPPSAACPPTAAARPAHVHDVRKRIKKLRGLLRLLEPGFRAFRAENAAPARRGQALASLRDSTVRLATFDSLFPEAPDPSRACARHLHVGGRGRPRPRLHRCRPRHAGRHPRPHRNLAPRRQGYSHPRQGPRPPAAAPSRPRPRPKPTPPSRRCTNGASRPSTSGIRRASSPPSGPR